ncbi:MAG: FeoB-associated Cys-rich membrane protein [Neisseria sp.]
MIQYIIVALIVIACTIYAIKKLFLNKTGPKCQGCNGCEPKQKCNRSP